MVYGLCGCNFCHIELSIVVWRFHGFTKSELPTLAENHDDLEKHLENSHEKNSENLSEIETIETKSGPTVDETYKCSMCGFYNSLQSWFKKSHN